MTILPDIGLCTLAEWYLQCCVGLFVSGDFSRRRANIGERWDPFRRTSSSPSSRTLEQKTTRYQQRLFCSFIMLFFLHLSLSISKLMVRKQYGLHAILFKYGFRKTSFRRPPGALNI